MSRGMHRKLTGVAYLALLFFVLLPALAAYALGGWPGLTLLLTVVALARWRHKHHAARRTERRNASEWEAFEAQFPPAARPAARTLMEPDDWAALWARVGFTPAPARVCGATDWGVWPAPDGLRFRLRPQLGQHPDQYRAVATELARQLGAAAVQVPKTRGRDLVLTLRMRP